MIICDVVGNVWATKKDESLNGLKFLIVKPRKYFKNSKSDTFVAVDIVGAGIGETVLVVSGSSARKAINKGDIPVDSTIVGIVDEVEISKKD